MSEEHFKPIEDIEKEIDEEIKTREPETPKEEKPEEETYIRKEPKKQVKNSGWITAGFLLLLVFISVFAYIFFTNLYYVKNHACVACVQKYDATCYFNNNLYYMENNELKSREVMLPPQNFEPISEWN